MRTLFVIKSVALGGGGAERVLANVSRTLPARGQDVTIVSFDRAGTEPFYDYAGVRLIELSVGDVASHTSLPEIMGRISELRRLLVQMRPDVAVGFMHSAYIPMGLAALGTGVPMVASEHISYEHYLSRPLERQALRLTPWVSAAMTVQTQSVREGFPAALRRHMEVIPNPVDFRPSKPTIGKSRKTILAVGRLEEQKDQQTLVEAFAKVAGRYPDWDLRIVGEGRLRSRLEALVRHRGLDERIRLPGLIPDIAAEYAAADLFAMPSIYESFGIATAEALASGLPAIGFADCPGTNELIEHQVNGLLVSGPHRAEALAAGLAQLMGDEELRAKLARAAPASVAAYSPEAVVDRWQQLLSRVARKNGGRA